MINQAPIVARQEDCFLFSCSNSFMSPWLDRRESVLYWARSETYRWLLLIKFLHI